MIKRSAVLFFLFWFLVCSSLRAHEKTPAYLKLVTGTSGISASFKFPLDRHGNPTISVEFPATWKRVTRRFTAIGDLGIEDIDFEPTSLQGQLRIIRTVLSDAPLVITVTENGKSATVLVDADSDTFELGDIHGSAITIFKSFTLLGVEHILLGIDHLLFVLALLFLTRGKQLIGAITSFTLAHSITLVMSTLQIMTIPSTVVEALIAFSIVLMAVEVFKPAEQHQTRNYIAMAFFFGLLHGFGFAGVLAELGLPKNNLLMALFSFNVGVELGQLVFVGFVLVLMPLLTRMIPKDALVKICSYVIGSVGAFWFLDRTIGVWFL